jgi:GNAT superfamily N-acetyltransferase
MTTVIRPWAAQDELALLHMVTHCLEINYDAGADMQPTLRNAQVLVKLGMLAATRGEPCLVADAGGIDCPGPIGYTLWCSLPNPLDLDYRGRVIYGLGTYVMPPFQNTGVSRRLRNGAESEARQLGFTKVVGVAYHSVGLKSVLSRGYRVAGQHVEKVLA